MQHARPERTGEQILLACDPDGRFSGEYVQRDTAHQGDGRRHLAVAVLLYNRAGELLLQRRKHRLFDDVWDLTGATHPLHRPDGTDESLDDAAHRCLAHEYDVSVPGLVPIGAFVYFAQDRDGLHCEHEHCTVFVAVELADEDRAVLEIGRASCRERV